MPLINYDNSYSGQRVRVIEWMRAHGVPERAQIQQEPGGVFGAGGPPVEWNARRRAMEEWTKEQDEFLKVLTDRLLRMSGEVRGAAVDLRVGP